MGVNETPRGLHLGSTSRIEDNIGQKDMDTQARDKDIKQDGCVSFSCNSKCLPYRWI